MNKKARKKVEELAKGFSPIRDKKGIIIITALSQAKKYYNSLSEKHKHAFNNLIED